MQEPPSTEALLVEYQLAQALADSTHTREWAAMSIFGGGSMATFVFVATSWEPDRKLDAFVAVAITIAAGIALGALFGLLRRSHLRVQVARFRQGQIERLLGLSLISSYEALLAARSREEVSAIISNSTGTSDARADLGSEVDMLWEATHSWWRDRYVFRLLPAAMFVPWLGFAVVEVTIALRTTRW